MTQDYGQEVCPLQPIRHPDPSDSYLSEITHITDTTLYQTRCAHPPLPVPCRSQQIHVAFDRFYEPIHLTAQYLFGNAKCVALNRVERNVRW